jgi:hypothetical protein
MSDTGDNQSSPNPTPVISGTASKFNADIGRIILASKNDDDKDLKRIVKEDIESIMSSYNLDSYKLVILFDEHDSIGKYHASSIYSAVSSLRENPKDVMLIISSSGGSIEPAYLISKTLKRVKKNKFTAVVPRRAKSAATLICLGADEIHMGMMSELGPIDPQIAGLPALALGNSLDLIADLVTRFPEASAMFGRYIADQAPIRVLGYFQRVNESAVQYAERLLIQDNLPDGKTTLEVADHLVNHYKDHSFVIDFDECRQILGDKIVKESTDEYNAGDDVYKYLELVGIITKIDNKEFWISGSSEDFVWRNIS